MIFQNDKISIRQLQALLIMDILGMGIVVLPKRAAMFAGQDGWIVAILSTLLACAAAFLIATAGRIFPEKYFNEYSGAILGRPLGVLLSAGLFAKIMICTGMELRIFGEIVKQVMLPNTPLYAVSALVVISGLVAAAAGYEARARAGEILIFLAIIPMAIFLVLAAAGADFSNLMPAFGSLLDSPLDRVALGGGMNMITFTGIEFLYFVYPFIKSKNAGSVRRASVQAVITVGAMALVATFVSIAQYGPRIVAQQKWPVIELMDGVGVPGSFFERQDALIMSFWIVAVYAMASAGIFFMAILSKSVLKLGGHRRHTLACALIVYLISLAAANDETADAVLNFMFIWFGAAYYFVVPLALIAVARIRGLGAK